MHQDRTKLSDDEIQEELRALANWEIVEGKLHRELKFENFIEAFAFMTKLAMVAERLNHHPEWTNVYNKVSLWLTTHDVAGILRFRFRPGSRGESLLRRVTMASHQAGILEPGRASAGFSSSSSSPATIPTRR